MQKVKSLNVSLEQRTSQLSEVNDQFKITIEINEQRISTLTLECKNLQRQKEHLSEQVEELNQRIQELEESLYESKQVQLDLLDQLQA